MRRITTHSGSYWFVYKCLYSGVTATPLSSNIKLPMHESYDELIVGDTISSLIDNGFLAKQSRTARCRPHLFEGGINGDYTVKSSDDLYTNMAMQEKLLHAYTEKSLGKKTLIFNNGIIHRCTSMKHLEKRGIHSSS
jgi:hypothetical protein